jgi:putative tricarboxylic transport membrane protein
LILVFFGIFGYIARKLHFDVTPMVMGFILGPPLEYAFGQSMSLSGGNVWHYMFFDRPIAGVILAITPIITFLLWRRALKLRREYAEKA